MQADPSTQQHLIGLEISRETEAHPDFDQLLEAVDVVEFITESAFFDKRRSFLEQLKRASTKVIGHSVELSVGSCEPLKSTHLDSIRRVLEQTDTLVYSDHLCLTEAGQVGLGQLTTLPFTQEASDVCCKKIEEVKNATRGYPFLIENITNRFIVPGCSMSEPEFINSITRRTGAGLLVDLTNLYINATNFGFSPTSWLEQIDLKSIKGIHLAGGEKEDGVLYDTHSQQVHSEVWDLFQYVVERANPMFTIIEWDQNPPPPNRLVEEVAKARQIVARVTERNLHSTQLPGSNGRSSQEEAAL